MIILRGRLLNIFVTPKGTNKEGQPYGGDDKLQVLNEVTLKNGEKRMDLLALTVSDSSKYRDDIGKELELPVDVYAYQGKIGFRLVQ